MAKKPTQRKAEVMRHARIELYEEDYAELEGFARELGLSISAYIRFAVKERMRADRERNTQGGKP